MVVEAIDAVVLGAGLRGLAAGLRIRQATPAASLLIVDRAPQPGGSLRTQRTQGYVCEHGAFAFAPDEAAALAAPLRSAPATLMCDERARNGWLFTGQALEPIPVAPEPVAFRGGSEDIVQACRRELGAVLRLGREVTAIDRDDDGFAVQLGGEVGATLRTGALTVALPCAAAARLLGRFDPRLADAAARVQQVERAFVFLGGQQAKASEIRGYGVVAAPAVATPVAEMIFCSEVFPRRAPAGQFLVRIEVIGPPADDGALLASAEQELRRWTGLTARIEFARVHRFVTAATDGSLVECRARMRELPSRVPGLAIA